MILTEAERVAIFAQAIVDYPAECCGVVLVRNSERLWLRCHNEQDTLHQQDPLKYPRTSRDAYHMHNLDRLLMVKLEQQGFSVAVIYHSHIDCGAYFSETDRRNALGGLDPGQNEPMYPEAMQIVISVLAGNGAKHQARIAEVAGFKWDSRQRDFVPADLELAFARDLGVSS